MTDSRPSAPALLHLGRGVNHFLRVVAAGAGEDRHAAVGFVDEDLDDPQRARRRVSVGLSPVVPHGHEEMDAGVDLPAASRRTAASSSSPLLVNGVTSAVPTPVNGVLIASSRLPYRALELAYATDPSTSCIVNQPRLPCTHCAAVSAPRANAGPIARRVRQRNRFRRAVEADRVRARE